jgi:large subunit ribosomal protein L17
MRHRKSGRKLSRKKANRDHLIRNLTTSLILYEKIVTTEAKAKTVKGEVERMINLGKVGGLNVRRQLAKYLFSELAVKKILEDLSGQFAKKSSGMTRIIKLKNRQGDDAPMVAMELLVKHKEEKEEKAKDRQKRTLIKAKKEPKKRGFWDRLRNRNSRISTLPSRSKKTVERTTSK